MADTDTETIELTREEAREVINALTNFQVQATGRDEERALNLREFLEREFDFEEEHFDDRRGPLEIWDELFGGEGHEIQLVRAEAAEVAAALAEFEADTKQSEAETVENLRQRFEDAFDLDATYAS